jgi:thiol:disulfide interchange protein DsbD
MSYGYGNEVLLLMQIRTPASLAPGELKLAGRVDWLECKDACLPGKAELEIALPVASNAARPLPDWAAAFRKTRERLPRAAPGVKAEAVAAGAEMTLTIAGLPAPKQAYFFPAKPDVLDHAAAQKLVAAEKGFRLHLTRAGKDAPPEQIEGVLEADGGFFEIRAPVRVGKPQASGAPSSTATSLPVALAFAFLGGLILNLMPCVLPVLSLKVVSFVRHGAGSLAGALRHGLAFTLGALVFFWILAFALLALRAAGHQIGWGFQLQSPPFLVFLAGLFLLVALNLFGVFEIGQSLTAAANLGTRFRGLASSFWSGALATIVATPCTAPFMGGALGFALGQPAGSTLLVFTALGLGMASPYLLLSASPRLLALLPRPGRWMETLKQAMGFPMLGTVVFVVWVFGRQAGVNAMTCLLAALLLIAAGAWLYGRGTTLASAAFVLLGIALGLSQAQAAPAEDARSSAGWEPYSEERLAELQASGAPVFVDFTADWCLTCQVNDRVALRHAEVQARLAREGVLMMRADWTLHDERITRALAGHGRQGVPLYVLYGRGRESRPRLLPEVLTPGIVLRALDEAF